MIYRRSARSERIRAESRRRILAAARQLFASRGYRASTMHAIAARAQTSIGNLYFYFRSKDDLLVTLLEELLGQIYRRADEVAAGLEAGVERLAVAAHAAARGTLENGEVARIVLAADAHPRTRSRYQALYRGRLHRWLEENAPSLSGEDVEFAAIAWIGMLRALLHRLHGEEPGGDIRISDRSIVLWLLRGLGLGGAEVSRGLRAVEQRLQG